jgi:hypothetical protein
MNLIYFSMALKLLKGERERASFVPQFFWSCFGGVIIFGNIFFFTFPLFQSYVHLTGTSWSLIYFVSFYLISVLLLLNLVREFSPSSWYMRDIFFHNRNFVHYDWFSLLFKLDWEMDTFEHDFILCYYWLLPLFQHMSIYGFGQSQTILTLTINTITTTTTKHFSLKQVG